MKNTLSIPRSVLTTGALSLFSFLHAGTVHWHGTDVHTVRDQNLVIKSNVTLPTGGTAIEALHRNVDVYIDRDVTVQASSSGESQLYLIAKEGYTITFHVKHNLTFQGSDFNKKDPLLIVQGGVGTVIWEIEGGRKLSYISHDNSSGTFYYLFMHNADEYGASPETLFRRSDEDFTSSTDSTGSSTDITISGSSEDVTISKSHHSIDEDVLVEIGQHSLLGFLSSADSFNSDNRGLITFDPANVGSGNMALEIKDTGAVIIAACRSTEHNIHHITNSSIRRSDIVGGISMFQVINGLGPDIPAGLFILNENHKLSELLIDPFLNLETRKPRDHYRGKFDGNKQWGMIVGANGVLEICDNAYIDYVGLASNKKPDVKHIHGCHGDAEHFIKYRNPSALTFDGSHDPNSLPATLIFGQTAGLYLLSGIDDHGHVRHLHNHHPFTVDPDKRTPGAGNIVMDVEGYLCVVGPEFDGAFLAAIQVLSLEVSPVGGPLFIFGEETNFPLRTYARYPDGLYRRYNSAAILVNNHMVMNNVALVHTDENHIVIESDDVTSEPTYIGGETFLFEWDSAECDLLESILRRPKIEFINSRFLIHTSVALTGVDLLIPNNVEWGEICLKNVSEFTFYQNGYAIDDGTGRTMILGTLVGSTAIDGITVISADAHLDIMQTQNGCELAVEPDCPTGNQTLFLNNAPNNDRVNEYITTSVFDQPSTHEIFLGNTTNISIGINADETGFDIDTNPWLRIIGNFFAFRSRGGIFDDPQLSAVEGQGGIFVDLNGMFNVAPSAGVTMGAMVVRSHNAQVSLPIDQVLFDPQIGLTNWKPDLETLQDIVLVGPDEVISDYTINWTDIQKNFNAYTPYPIQDISVAYLPPVTEENITLIPTIEGYVEQLQIQDSRFGDPATIKIRGGFVRELVFLTGEDLPGQAHVAIIVLEGGGQIGIGSANRNADSVRATTVIGRNGVMFISNAGGGVVTLNNSVDIEGLAPFLYGPFAPGSQLVVTATEPNDMTVESTGTLDLRSMTEGNILTFADELQVVFEPGSSMLMGGGTVQFANNTRLYFEPSLKIADYFDAIPLGPIDNTLDPLTPTPAADPHNQYAPLTGYGLGLSNTDPFRVVFAGTGLLFFNDDSSAQLPQGAILGIETIDEVIDPVCGEALEIPTTNIVFQIQENAQFLMGDDGNNIEGGALQVGNTVERPGHSVTWNLTMNGTAAGFIQGSKSFLGLATGLVRAAGSELVASNQLLVDTLFDVANISVISLFGEIVHNRVYIGDDPHSALVAIGQTATAQYNLLFADDIDEDPQPIIAFDTDLSNTRGGGNLALITQSDDTNGGAVAPIVEDQDDAVQVGTDAAGNPIFSERLNVSLLASLLLRENKGIDVFGLTGQQLFETQWKTLDAVAGATAARNLANAGSTTESFMEPTEMNIGTIVNGTILRATIETVLGGSGGTAENLLARA
ncbi:MAG TPA: hypothetical protein VEK38_02220, partial [Candidatus Bathyarchaeia archaeon]|nr:hypothetical protein [Candidatus Bathyarchaeia archaeon]